MFVSCIMNILRSLRPARVGRGWENVLARSLTGGTPLQTESEAATRDEQTLSSQPKQFSLPDYRFVYPEFLPNPDMSRRHRLAEKLERRDMLRRRTQIQIPEFYVGSILAVTVSDPQAPGKLSRFVGICILREGHGMRATMTLRNAVDQQGVEICYPLYNPTLQSIEVLRLERRLDDDLRYLRDAPLEYSTVPLDMEPEVSEQSRTGGVPLNDLRVPLRPRPWTWRWERSRMKGLILPELRAKFYQQADAVSEPWVKYDLMREYRASITAEDQQEIYADVHEHVQAQSVKQTARRRRVFTGPRPAS